MVRGEAAEAITEVFDTGKDSRSSEEDADEENEEGLESEQELIVRHGLQLWYQFTQGNREHTLISIFTGYSWSKYINPYSVSER